MLASSDDSPDWKSCRRGKIPWREADVAACADALYEALPGHAAALLRKGGLQPGSSLLQLDGHFAVTQAHIENNHIWVRPIVQLYPQNVPGGYFLADAMLHLYQHHFDGKLFVDGGIPELSVEAQAMAEASKLKRLVGGLRYLLRNSPVGKGVLITELKGYLHRNPRRLRKGHDGEPLPVADAQQPDEQPVTEQPIVAADEDLVSRAYALLGLSPPVAPPAPEPAAVEGPDGIDIGQAR